MQTAKRHLVVSLHALPVIQKVTLSYNIGDVEKYFLLSLTLNTFRLFVYRLSIASPDGSVLF